MKYLALMAVIFVSIIAQSQKRIEINPDNVRSWNEDAITADDLYRFPPDKATVAAVDRIMKYTGLKVNFELVAANVPAAVATMKGEKRLILYNQLFMKEIAQQTRTDWAALSVLAHEIGHHLNQHTLGSGGVKSEQELSADAFSGDVLYRMGASLDEAKAAMQSRPETRNPYYPKKSVRLIAIGNGWIGAQELDASKKPAPTPTPQTVTDQDADQSTKREAKAAADREARERIQQAKEVKEAEQERKEEEKERKAEEKAASSRGCYAYGRRFCSLPRNLPLGSTCWCYGVTGYGIVGNP
jgi:hypothetical protein